MEYPEPTEEIERLFGPRFLKKYLRNETRLGDYRRHRAPWAYARLQWILRALSSIDERSSHNSRIILSKLKNVRSEEEGLDFLEANHRLTEAGSSVQFEPWKGSDAYRPDILARAPNGTEFWVELTHCDEIYPDIDCLSRVSGLFRGPRKDFVYSIRLSPKKVITKEECDQILGLLQTGIATVVDDSKAVNFSNHLVTFAMAKNQNETEFQQFIAANEMDPFDLYKGPHYSTEVRRICKKIREKGLKPPSGSTVFLMIYTTNAMLFTRPENFRALLEIECACLPGICGVRLVTESFGRPGLSPVSDGGFGYREYSLSEAYKIREIFYFKDNESKNPLRGLFEF